MPRSWNHVASPPWIMWNTRMGRTCSKSGFAPSILTIAWKCGETLGNPCRTGFLNKGFNMKKAAALRLPKNIDQYATASEAASDLRKMADLMEKLGGLVVWEAKLSYLPPGKSFGVVKAGAEVGLHSLEPEVKTTGNQPSWGRWQLMWRRPQE